MAKAHRGAGITDLYNHARGTCPVCNRTGIKAMYEQEVSGTKVQVCKQCNAKMKHAK